jgi:hypothetical protein
VLSRLLTAQAARHDRVDPAWQAELDRIAASVEMELETNDGLAVGLHVCALLGVLPKVPPTTPHPGSPLRAGRARGPATDHKQLARVRALLAKAESTDYDEEAEALTAKAQELISRYALTRLLAEESPEADGDLDTVLVRRVWLDPPYVVAKANLLQQVASANRCRAVLSEQLGFSTVVGDAADLEAVDLLTTSLLLQANAAMLRHGQQVDHWGRSRTRSFRQSFLVSYAARIGQRLRETSDNILHDADNGDRLLPVLRDQQARVADTCDALFPSLHHRATSASNDHGWLAGHAAADLAQLDVHPNITEATGADRAAAPATA